MSKDIYIIEGIGTGLFKIGIASNLEKRLRGFRSTSAVPLALIAVILDASYELEGFLHLTFQIYSHHGEWFSLPHNWLELIPSRFRTRVLRVYETNVSFEEKRDFSRCSQSPRSEPLALFQDDVMTSRGLSQLKSYKIAWQNVKDHVEHAMNIGCEHLKPN